MHVHSIWVLLLAAWMAAPTSAQQPTLPKELSGFVAELAGAQVPPAHPKQRVAYAEALVQRAAPERYVLAAGAAKLGEGVGPAFQLVRDRIRFESYSGVLRGAELCFAARAGNALDRALVLAELLAAKGLSTRFVRGKLPRDRAAALIERIFAPELGLAQKAPTGDVQRSDLPARVVARARRDHGVVRAALGDALLPAALPSHDDLVHEVEQHFWIQAQQGKEWVDLDTAFTDAQVGQAFAKVEQIYAKLPDELHQHVTFRILAETVGASAIEETVVLEVKTTSEAVLDAQVMLAHTPDSGNRALGNTLAGKSASWQPVLWIGGESHVGSGIDYGLPNKGGIADVLSAQPPEPKPSPFVAEQLEIEISFPDGRSEVVRRALIDRAGPAWRLAGHNDISKLTPITVDAQGPIDARAVHCILASGGKHDLHAYSQSLLHLAHQLLADRESEEAARAAGIKADGSAASGATDDDPVATLWPFYLQNFGWLAWSDHSVIPALNDRDGLRFYADAPRIWMATLWIVGDDLKVMFDLRRDKVRAVARDPKAEGLAAAERKLWFAIVEGALEHEALAERGATMASDDVAVTTTSSRLAADGVLVLGRAALEQLKELVGTDAKKAAYLRLAIERGSLVVAPKAALLEGDTAWWEIHSRGDARAVFGADWNGARLQGGGAYRRGAKAPRPPRMPGQVNRPVPLEKVRPGKTTPKSGAAKGSGGGELGEYAMNLLTVAVPSSYAWFAMGLGIEVTAMFVGAAIIEDGAR